MQNPSCKTQKSPSAKPFRSKSPEPTAQNYLLLKTRVGNCAQQTVVPGTPQHPTSCIQHPAARSQLRANQTLPPPLTYCPKSRWRVLDSTADPRETPQKRPTATHGHQ